MTSSKTDKQCDYQNSIDLSKRQVLLSRNKENLMINTTKPPKDSTNRRICATGNLPYLKTRPQLNKIIVFANGRPDHLAINIYWNSLRSWCKNKNILKNQGIYTNYQKLSDVHGVSIEVIRRRIVKLEKLGFVSRSFEQGGSLSKNLANQLIIYVWKYTPYFTVPFAKDYKDEVVLKPQTNRDHIVSKKGSFFCLKKQPTLPKQEVGGCDV